VCEPDLIFCWVPQSGLDKVAIRPAMLTDLLREPPAVLIRNTYGFAGRDGVLPALRRSPLVGANLHLARSRETGR
jgi:hypothetical protein